MKDAPKLNLTKSLQEFEYAKSLIPGGVLGIRRPYNFVPGEYPVYFEKGDKGYVYDIDGNKYIDYLCAYGPIILGYREKEVDEAVIEQIREKGFCFSLSQTLQNRLAEKINQLIPCAEMSIFVKTGSDATTLAIRLARAYTNRKKIIRCGYHGWHDWCVEVKGGIPEKLYEDIHEIHYNEIGELEELVKKYGDDIAALIVTPVGHPLAEEMQEPKDNFLEKVKEIMHKNGSIVIFDEIRSGFRVSLGGAQKHYGVTPDMAVFGKAMANGYAIGCVTGKADIIKKAEKDVFVSSTFFSNSDSIVAALKTIEILERDKVLDNIREKGTYYLQKVNEILPKFAHLGVKITGIPSMSFITFDRDKEKKYKDRRTEFYTQLIRRGVFQQPFHHGYICYRHSYEDLNYTIKSIEESLEVVSEKIK
ncbi:MAG TPA: aminotransferase class III-fold pyridoxal phosphate-dependent enzyme [Ignavibacteriales bacterium]|jgi:glutamate-1-semialdehyde aminotransferase|nr:aminotransferase class III-fold pyridoxal phosphate-dependent enzyme [Ignavibacteriales bacterium]